MVVTLAPPFRILPLLALAGAVGCFGSGKGSDAEEAASEGARAGECADGADNDQDGDFDCNDADCSGAPDCSEANTTGGCTDGADNDRDGTFDCADSDCVGNAACGDGIEGNGAGECEDGLDQDADGLVDCADPECEGSATCDTYEGDEAGECSDGVDNDRSGQADCADANCAGSPDCQGSSVDADGDGVTADEDCDDTNPSYPSVDDADCDGVATHLGGGDLVRIPAGTFEMGCTDGQGDCFSGETPVMPVELTNDYYIGVTEVTQGEFQAVTGLNPSGYSECGADCPVENLTWHMGAAFANALSRAAGLTECYTCSGSLDFLICTQSMDPYECDGYRYPTEAEWENAARCGTDSRYAGGDDIGRLGWYSANYGGTTHQVAQKAPNACGLYDMSGNVWEWTRDWYNTGYYSASGRTDPTGASSGSRGAFWAMRGGSLVDQPEGLRVASRWYLWEATQQKNVGFRVARTVR